MRDFIGVALVSLFSMSAVAHASEWITFKTTGHSRYLNSEIRISRWADALLMKSILVDRGREFEVEATLEPQTENSYRGAGRITVRYENNRGCTHRFGAEIRISNGEIYLRENTPAAIPFDPNSPCVAAGPYEWYNYPEPYVAQ